MQNKHVKHQHPLSNVEMMCDNSHLLYNIDNKEKAA